jgi:hypothetical protein
MLTLFPAAHALLVRKRRYDFAEEWHCLALLPSHFPRHRGATRCADRFDQ